MLTHLRTCLPSNSRSPELLNLTKRWLNVCQTSHKACREDVKTTWYPTKLLRVTSKPSGARLVVTKGQHMQGGYATLSHCWGSKPIVRLVCANLVQFQQEIDATALPKTFQDAISLCRSFGLRYIWIDSLCIVRAPAETRRLGANCLPSDTG